MIKNVSFIIISLFFLLIVSVSCASDNITKNNTSTPEKTGPLDFTGSTGAVHGLNDLTMRNINRLLDVDSEEAARQIVEDAVNEKATGKLFDIKIRKTNTDPKGSRHIRMDQKYLGIRIVGGEIIAHINKDNILYMIKGKYLPNLNISVEPTIDEQEAVSVGLDDLKEKDNLKVKKGPTLVIYSGKLSYHYVITHGKSDFGNWNYYIAADSGIILLKYSDIKY